jgi:hypothetical protein
LSNFNRDHNKNSEFDWFKISVGIIPYVTIAGWRIHFGWQQRLLGDWNNPILEPYDIREITCGNFISPEGKIVAHTLCLTE